MAAPFGDTVRQERPDRLACGGLRMGAILRRSAGLMALSALLALAPLTPAMAETVRLRDGVHADYSRLVLDYAQNTRYDVLYQTSSEIALRLASPLKPDLSGFRAGAHKGISKIAVTPDGDKYDLLITLDTPMTVKPQRVGTKLVFDLYVDTSPRSTAPAPAQPKQQQASRISINGDAPSADAPPQQTTPTVIIGKEELAGDDPQMKALLDQLEKLEASIRIDPVTRQSELERTAPSPEPLTWEDFTHREEARVEGGLTNIRIDPGVTAPAVVFTRGESLWVVIDTPDIQAAPLISGTHAARLRGKSQGHSFASRATVYRWPLPKKTFPQVRRDGRVWEISLSKHAALMEEYPIMGEKLGESGRGELIVLGEQLGEPMLLPDPEVGDELILIPSSLPSEGVGQERRFADLTILRSAQGLVIRPLLSGLKAVRDDKGALITHDKGLRLSDRWLQPPADHHAAKAMPDAEDAIELLHGRRLFETETWQRRGPESFFYDYMAIQKETVEADPAERPARNLDLAKFLFAHGMAEEAAGALRLAISSDPRLASVADIRALRGALTAMVGDPEEAALDLTDAALADLPEAKLWFGIAATHAGDWQQATTAFKESEGAALTYTPSLYNRIAPAMLDSALAQGDVKQARMLLEHLKKTSDGIIIRPALIAWYAGELARQEGDTARAAELWERAAQSADYLYRTKSILSLVDMGRKDESMTPEEAINRLEPMRFAWRGDTLEMAILERLGRLYIEAGKFREGLDILTKAVGYFPNTAEAEELNRATVRAFVDIFASGSIGKVSPIEAYGVWSDYKELTPEGPAGAVIIERLAERLIEVDLADQAADLLTQLMEERLRGVEKARVGTRAAAMRIIAERPLEAMQILDKSDTRGLSREMIRDRHLLKVRATADMGDAEGAYKMLEDYQGDDVERLRADLARQAGDWPAVAAALGRLIPAPPTEGMISKDNAQLVLSRAVALSLAKDDAGLNDLRRRYSEAMKGTDQDHPFHLVTRGDLDPQDHLSMQTIRRAMREVDLFNDFLNTIGSNTPEDERAG